MQFLTIRQAAKAVGLPDTCLRGMLATGNLPGFYGGENGGRFYVNFDLLLAKLEQDSRSTMEKRTEARAQ